MPRPALTPELRPADGGVSLDGGMRTPTVPQAEPDSPTRRLERLGVGANWCDHDTGCLAGNGNAQPGRRTRGLGRVPHHAAKSTLIANLTPCLPSSL